MKWFKLIAVTMLVWGNAALADLPDAADDLRQDIKTIKSWTADLSVRGLNVKARGDISDPETARGTLKDLETLENLLEGRQAGEPGQLIFLSCPQPVCFSDGD